MSRRRSSSCTRISNSRNNSRSTHEWVDVTPRLPPLSSLNLTPTVTAPTAGAEPILELVQYSLVYDILDEASDRALVREMIRQLDAMTRDEHLDFMKTKLLPWGKAVARRRAMRVADKEEAAAGRKFSAEEYQRAAARVLHPCDNLHWDLELADPEEVGEGLGLRGGGMDEGVEYDGYGDEFSANDEDESDVEESELGDELAEDFDVFENGLILEASSPRQLSSDLTPPLTPDVKKPPRATKATHEPQTPALPACNALPWVPLTPRGGLLSSPFPRAPQIPPRGRGAVAIDGSQFQRRRSTRSCSPPGLSERPRSNIPTYNDRVHQIRNTPWRRGGSQLNLQENDLLLPSASTAAAQREAIKSGKRPATSPLTSPLRSRHPRPLNSSPSLSSAPRSPLPPRRVSQPSFTLDTLPLLPTHIHLHPLQWSFLHHGAAEGDIWRFIYPSDLSLIPSLLPTTSTSSPYEQAAELGVSLGALSHYFIILDLLDIAERPDDDWLHRFECITISSCSTPLDSATTFCKIPCCVGISGNQGFCADNVWRVHCEGRPWRSKVGEDGREGWTRVYEEGAREGERLGLVRYRPDVRAVAPMEERAGRVTERSLRVLQSGRRPRFEEESEADGEGEEADGDEDGFKVVKRRQRRER